LQCEIISSATEGRCFAGCLLARHHLLDGLMVPVTIALLL